MAVPVRETRLARGWSQARLIAALESAATTQGVSIANRSSLKVMVSRWENGKAVPHAIYRQLLSHVLELTDEQLGFGLSRTTDGNCDPYERLPRLCPGSVDSNVVEFYQSMLANFCRLDSTVGPRCVISPLLASIKTLEEFCDLSRGDTRTALLFVGARFAELAGWLFQDCGDHECAEKWTHRAMEYAAELDDQQLLSYVLMRTSGVALDADNPGRALDAATAALSRSSMLSPALRALALRQKAYAHAMFGEVDECSRCLDEAAQQARNGDSSVSGTDYAAYCTPQFIAMESATSWLRLGRSEAAAQTYANSVADWPHDQQRDLGLCRSRLALAYAMLGEVEHACLAGMEAADTVRRAPSARTLGVLRRVSAQVAPSRRIEAVRDLRESLDGLV